MVALFQNKTEIAKLLLEKGADVNAKNDLGVTVLMTAAGYFHQTGIVKLLLEKGADVNVKTKAGTALEWAVEYQDIEKLLLEKGAHRTVRYYWRKVRNCFTFNFTLMK